MDRTYSASNTTHPLDPVGLDSPDLERCAPSYSYWQCASQEPAGDYTLFAENSTRHPYVLPPSIDEGVCLSKGNSMVEYSPVDYSSTVIEPLTSNSFSAPTHQHSPQQQGQFTRQWCSSSDGSASPSTPLTVLMTPVTQSSDMSRQSSYDANFVDISMLSVPSDSSCMLPIPLEDGSFPFSFDTESKAISSNADGIPFSQLTDSSEDFLISSSTFPSLQLPASASAHGLASINPEQSDLAEDMWRSTSTSSRASSISDASLPSPSCSRHTQRKREINARAASRQIAPKAVKLTDETTTSLPCNAQMAKIQSSDGSSKTVGLLTKAPYVRPAHPKIMCQFCNERPDGFRGTHELERHIARSHAPCRKGYICVDASENGKFLAACKHCRAKKVYGAYYNAAAHLRRAHFHPRKRGRKGKNDEKRGGIGGGDDPPMDYLKQNWIREVEVTTAPKKAMSGASEAPSQSPDDKVSESFSDPITSATTTVMKSAAASCRFSSRQLVPPPSTPPPSTTTATAAIPTPLDSSHVLDYEMNSIHANNSFILLETTLHATTTLPPFDPTLHLVTPNHLQHFQFDADIHSNTQY